MSPFDAEGKWIPPTPEEIAREESDNAEARRLHEQMSAAEVPGFAARTIVDDAIGKLLAVRSQLLTPLPGGVAAMLDDLDAATDRLVELAVDEDAVPLWEDGPPIPGGFNHHGERWADTYCTSASDTLGSCSCGAVTV